MNGKFYWSENDESFPENNGPFDTRPEAIAAAAETLFDLYVARAVAHIDERRGCVDVHLVGETKDEFAPSFFTARRRDVDLLGGVDFGTPLVEELEQRIADECGPVADNCLEYDAVGIDELSRAVEAAFAGWLLNHTSWHPWVAEDQHEHNATKHEDVARLWIYPNPDHQPVRAVDVGHEIAPGMIALPPDVVPVVLSGVSLSEMHGRLFDRFIK